jgi:catechol 2,3-dioxygenase-like lactoylglutathione lyase family enzyme
VPTPSPLRGLSTVNFFAADHAAARQWYTEFLGVEPYFERPGYVEFRVGDYQHELGIIDSAFVPGMGNDGRAGGIVYWHVDDLEATFQRLLSMGAREHDGPRDRGTKGFRTASVIDPFGNLMGIMINPHYLEILASLKPA